MKLADLLPKETDRAFFCGVTGCGKTTLAQKVLGEFKFISVFDGKGFFGKELESWTKLGYIQLETFSDYVEAANEHENGMFVNPRLIYTPNADELEDIDTINQFFDFCYNRKNNVVYVDEIYSIADQYKMPKSLKKCYTRGRSRGVMVFGSSQRPADIPSVCFSESENRYIFLLTKENDRKRIEKDIDVSSKVIKSLQKHQFIFSRLGEFNHSPKLKLNLKGK